MKTIGLIGGMSWESSLKYYQIINNRVREKLGTPHSCKSIMYSVDFAEFKKLQDEGEWQVLKTKMINVAQKLEQAGADLILICTNTLHKLAKDVQQNINIPLLHITDATAEAIKTKKIDQVGLLGTKFTMEQNFYKQRLRKKHKINVLLPNQQERNLIHDIIYKELISGIIKEKSKTKFKKIISNLKKKGAQGVILGCTEIPMLIKEEDSVIPIFNTTLLHAKKAVTWALQ